MRVACAVVLLLLLGLAAGFAAADRESSQFFVQRAEKALAARNWPEAEQHYRRALEEDPTNLPARHGLSEAFLGAGQRAAALEELRRFCTEAESADPLPTGWGALLTKARRRLAELDVTGNELEKIVTDHAAALLAFAGRWKEKDPDMAVRALSELLALRPGHPKASEMLEALGSDAGVKWIPIWNGKNMDGWSRMGPPTWRIEEGLLVARPVDGSYIGMSTVHLEGDFDLRMEVRMGARTGKGLAMVALTGTHKDERIKVLVGILGDEIVVREYDGHPDDFRQIRAVLPRNVTPPVDPAAWNRFELRYRKDTVEARVNGRELATFPRTTARDKGYVALQVQDCNADFRRVEYVQH